MTSRVALIAVLAVAFAGMLAGTSRTSAADPPNPDSKVATPSNDRPFLALISGNAHLSPTNDPNVLENNETGGGTATHLGKFDWSTVEFADFDEVPGGVAVVGSFKLTAANGDELHGVHVTIGLFNANGDLVLHGHFMLVGGTGRFADATGEGTLDAVASLGVGLPFTGTLDGTIDY